VVIITYFTQLLPTESDLSFTVCISSLKGITEDKERHITPGDAPDNIQGRYDNYVNVPISSEMPERNIYYVNKYEYYRTQM
jgi:hypothetical protein